MKEIRAAGLPPASPAERMNNVAAQGQGARLISCERKRSFGLRRGEAREKGDW